MGEGTVAVLTKRAKELLETLCGVMDLDALQEAGKVVNHHYRKKLQEQIKFLWRKGDQVFVQTKRGRERGEVLSRNRVTYTVLLGDGHKVYAKPAQMRKV